MKLSRIAPIAAIAMAGTLALSACGGGSATGESGGDKSGGSDKQLSGSLTGIGSSAQKSAVQAWTADFTGQQSGAKINYSPDGSGAGREQFLAGKAQFAGSDAYMKDEEIEKSKSVCGDDGAFEFPVYISPIAIAYNLKGVDKLQLSPETLAKVFAGKITSWNDEAIKKDNPDANLPSTKITAVHRSDESGTTKNFTDYLNKAAKSAWPDEAAEEFPKKAGGEAAQGTDGIVQTVTKTDGAIGYADASATGDLNKASIKVGENYEAPTAEAAAKVVDESPTVSGRHEHDLAIDLKRDITEAGTYPIVLVSYHIVCSSYKDQSTADLVKGWETYVVSQEGQDSAKENAGSAPISDKLREKITPIIDAVKAQG
ncbi:phosphate ABC transporter substrate-binding protein PstS [Brevibacterium sp. 5221]|uniref:Phosphate-binding protein n=1 Tax=Brevibacterium rongguiense TaxID=2695267 RepID=A0A6N9H6F2_9MICO|nr:MULTISPECIES: phosphate ABC transporter substrate-binding protein PstS [Brevibacterium]MYM19529.1 phosphate ABC transporter substrate-binding protein PstS [Brevibacterium rongguiense]WAL39967.1 phosphate ABC transporter substrate-binding protein PstS [Brevibacterium sp. BRM-1]